MKDLNSFAKSLLEELAQTDQKSKANNFNAANYNSLDENTLNDDIDILYRQLEEVAAVSGRFAPSDLVTDNGASVKHQILNRLSQVSIVETTEKEVRWLLGQARRSVVLGRLVEEKMLDQVLMKNLPSTDLFGEMLRDILRRGRSFTFQSLSHEELLAISAASEALVDTGIPLPDTDQIRQLITKDSLFNDYKMLLDSNFVGRKKELNALDLFFREGNTRQLNSNWDGIVVHGFGGAGKSTLLAKFAQQVVKNRQGTIVMLDFDRPGIDPNPRDTFALEAEITRQVELQYPQQSKRLRNVREEIRQRRAEPGAFSRSFNESFRPIDSNAKSRGFRSQLIEVINETLENENMTCLPFLLILDTFEEVIQRDLSKQMFDWISDLTDALVPTKLRVIFSGRLFDTSLTIFERRGLNHAILINELSATDAQRVLQHLGVTETMAKRLTKSGIFPLRPLELQLLGKIANREESSLTIDELEAEILLGGEKAKELFIGLIYRRVLLRINDPVTEALAYPGLVLRYVTSEIIRQVLVPVLELPALTLQEAESALKKLASYDWLVQYKETDGQKEVWHRRDLRQSMLHLMLSEDQDKTRRISEAASQYFRTESPTNKIEALYQRLIWMNSPEQGDDYDLDELKELGISIGGYISDLPKPAAALVKFAVTGRVQSGEVSLLPRQYLAMAYQKTGMRLVNDREFSKALRLLRRGQKERIFGESSINNPRESFWEKETLFATACWNELRYTPANSSIESELTMFFLNRLYPVAITDPVESLVSDVEAWLSQTNRVEFEVAKASKWKASDFDKLVTGFSLSLVSLNERLSLDANRIDSLRYLQRLEDLNLQVNNSARLQRKLIMLSWIGEQRGIESYWLGPSLLRLDLSWLMKLAEVVRKIGFSVEIISLLEYTVNTFQSAIEGRQKTIRALLRSIDGLYKDRELWKQTRFWFAKDFKNSDELLNMFRGPDTEFRDPCRFALLEAFPDPASRRKLAVLIQSLIPFELIDLAPDSFVEALSTDPEIALENYIELVDRTWQLGPLMVLALQERPDSSKLRTVASAHARWDNSVRKLIITHFDSFKKTR